VDRYGRTLGRVFVDDVDVNRELATLGLAPHYVKYSDDAGLAEAEAAAREAAVGLWADADPITHSCRQGGTRSTPTETEEEDRALNRKRVILVLDDVEPRHDVFRAAAWQFQVVETYRPAAFEQAPQEVDRLTLISLDHDLPRAHVAIHGSFATSLSDSA
jgi:hypothetical protein